MKKKILSLFLGTVILTSINSMKVPEVKNRELEEVYGGFYQIKIKPEQSQKIILWDEKKVLQFKSDKNH